MKKYVELDCLWKCETCFHHRSGKCSLGMFDCDHGESYRPAYNKLTIIESEIVQHGKWLINPDGYYPYCSECKEEPESGKMTKYCPNCGTRMDLY